MHHLTVLLFTSALAVTLSSAATQNTYVIRSRSIDNVPEAVKLLRRFMPDEPNSAERCEKYAVLIHVLRSSSMDQFKVADLALSNRAAVQNQIKTIDAESLRRAYIDGINALNTSELDPAFLELVACLRDKFRLVDAKARSFLNNRDLQDTVSQYTSILNQPLDFLLDPNVKHPSLTSAELKPAVRRTLDRMFNGDAAQVEARFSPLSAPLRPAATALATASNARAASVASVPGDLEETAATAAQVESPASQIELTPDEKTYLDNLATALQHVYQGTAPTTKLNDRCQAYTRLFDFEKVDLNERTVEGLAAETRDSVSKFGSTDVVFTPDKKARDNYLFALSTYEPAILGDETWFDLVDCVSQWEETDPDVKTFMHAPELERIFRRIVDTN